MPQVRCIEVEVQSENRPGEAVVPENMWAARGGLLRLSLEEVRGRFGEEVAQDVLRCARELDEYDASRRVGLELPWHPVEDRELEPAEVIQLMDRELALAANLSYRYHDEPFDEQLTGEFADVSSAIQFTQSRSPSVDFVELVFEAPWESPTANAAPARVPAPRAARGPSRAKRARARSQQRARQRSVGSAAAVYTASAAGHASARGLGTLLHVGLHAQYASSLTDRFQHLLEEVLDFMRAKTHYARLTSGSKSNGKFLLRGHLVQNGAPLEEPAAQVHSSSVVKPGVDLTGPTVIDSAYPAYPVPVDSVGLETWPLEPILEDAALDNANRQLQDLAPSAKVSSWAMPAPIVTGSSSSAQSSRRGSKNGAMSMDPPSQLTSRFSRQDSYEAAVAAEQSNTFTPRHNAGSASNMLRNFKAMGTRDLQAANTWLGRLLGPLVLTWQFEFFYAFLIVCHAILLGAQIEWEASNLGSSPPNSIFFLHFAFTFLFFVEIVLRMATIGVVKFFTASEYAWNIFDLLMVSLSIVELLVDLILQEHFASGTFRILRILRLARSARGLRIIRLIRFIRPLRILVFSIGITLKSLIWSVILLLLIIYLFSILFSDAYLTAVASSYPQGDVAALQTFFGSLQLSMLTLFAAISGGLEWRHAMSPLSVVGWVWAALFILYIAFCIFAVLNVMTGVFCHSAIAGAEQDHEFMVQSMVGEQERIRTVFGELFRTMDHDGSGMITIKEFEQGFKVESTKAWFEALGIKAEDAWTIFRSLDRDGDHRIGVSEFVEGCINIRGPAREVDLMRQSQMTHQQLQAVGVTLLDSLVLLKDVAAQLIDTSETIKASHSQESPVVDSRGSHDHAHLAGVESCTSHAAI
ncbi:CAC [Symbiodinium natans]|uniref:CAC protein n=1 Tax=Symbiodinium natans TaxID=878477 RepID=A0A812SQ78_9DINO|nr:CAC [Symbiodinium natans]